MKNFLIYLVVLFALSCDARLFGMGHSATQAHAVKKAESIRPRAHKEKTAVKSQHQVQLPGRKRSIKHH